MDSEKHLYMPNGTHSTLSAPISSSTYDREDSEKHIYNPNDNLSTTSTLPPYSMNSDKHLHPTETQSTFTPSSASNSLQIVKQYTLIRHGRQTDFQFFHNNTLVLSSATKPATFMTGTLNTVLLPSGAVAAACKAKGKGWSSHSLLLLGDDPSSAPESAWIPLKCERKMRESKYSFSFDGRPYSWRRTHDKELGSRKRSFRDFKLVNETEPERVLAVWIDNDGCSGVMQSSGAVLKYYAELERGLELLSLAALLRIEDHIRNSEQAAWIAAVAS